MQSEELIKKIITEVLFNVQFDKLPLVWQEKVNIASRELYIRVLKPLLMINNVLLDTEEKLKQENLHLQQDKRKLLNRVQQLKLQGRNDSKEKNGDEH
jgi:hypothetical protein